MSKSFRHVIVAAAILALLAGCSSKKEENCPSVSSIVDTAIGTYYRPGAPVDPSNVLYTVEIDGLKASCSVDKDALNSSSDVTVTFKATRPPNGGALTFSVPYFVAISESDRVLAKKVYAISMSFEPGEITTTATDTVNSADVSAGRDKKTFDYLILVGLQLTKAQLEHNRASGSQSP